MERTLFGMKQRKFLIPLGACALFGAIFLGSRSQEEKETTPETLLKKESSTSSSALTASKLSGARAENQLKENESTSPSSSVSEHKSSPREELQKRIGRQIGKQRGGQSSPRPGVSSSLGELLRSRGEQSTRSLVASIESFRSEGALSEQERASALELLNSPSAPESFSASEWHWIVDELITTLRADGANNEQLSQHLAELATSGDHDMITRDYALQHLGHIRSEGGDVEVIDRTLRNSLSETQGTLAGTALLALNTYAEDQSFGSEAIAIATGSEVDMRSRITAMQVAGQQGAQSAGELATDLATDSSNPVPLRMSAIATIADLGLKSETALLQDLSQSNDLRIRKSAQSSLERLQAQ